MNDAVILACARSPMTRAAKGALAFTRIDDVGAAIISCLLSRVPTLDKGVIEDVIIGCAMPEGEQGLNVARNISFLAGLPIGVAGVTVNRFCASSLDAIFRAAQSIWSGNGELFIAGGVESMSHVPMGGFNPSLNERLMEDGSPKAYISMGETAENIAKKYSISREEQDRFALMSHMKASSAWQQGRFEHEVVPVMATSRDGSAFEISRDEIPRPDTSMESLAVLAPSFVDGGTVTAGNSSPLTDGAAMIAISSKKFAKRIGVKPVAKIVAAAAAGVDPAMMGEGPMTAVPKLLRRAKMKIKDIDFIEINEAFASQTIAAIKGLGLDEKRVNVNGGAIALGHPLGASGARIVTTLVNVMAARGAGTGLAAMCVGGGQGMAMIVEKI